MNSWAGTYQESYSNYQNPRFVVFGDLVKYSWKRFWCPREGMINLSDGGFLLDPESNYVKWVEGNVVSYEEIAHKPCLALLGNLG